MPKVITIMNSNETIKKTYYDTAKLRKVMLIRARRQRKMLRRKINVISPKTLQMMDDSVKNLKEGNVSEPIIF